jgi:hypothetical protein
MDAPASVGGPRWSFKSMEACVTMFQATGIAFFSSWVLPFRALGSPPCRVRVFRALASAMLALCCTLFAQPASAQADPEPSASAPVADESAAAPADTVAPAAPVEPPPAMAAPASAPVPADTPAPAEAPAPAAPPPPPYSLPWQLRPAAIATVLRSDTAFASYKPAANGGFTVASMLLGSYKLTPEFAPFIRLGVVSNSPPAGTKVGPMTMLKPAESAFSFINPAFGGTYLFKLSPDFRLAAFLGLTLPIGMGGGAKPDANVALANGAGVSARSAMDNAMFAVDYFTIFPGVDFAYVNHGVTVQLEATIFQLARVRGKGTPPGADSSRTNFTSGLHLGYFFIPQLSAGAELRYQRWLSTPASIKSTPTIKRDTTKLRDTLSLAIGVRAHFKLSDTVWIRPGIAYARGLDDPMAAANYNIVQLDVPVSF